MGFNKPPKSTRLQSSYVPATNYYNTENIKNVEINEVKGLNKFDIDMKNKNLNSKTLKYLRKYFNTHNIKSA